MIHEPCGLHTVQILDPYTLAIITNKTFIKNTSPAMKVFEYLHVLPLWVYNIKSPSLMSPGFKVRICRRPLKIQNEAVPTPVQYSATNTSVFSFVN